MKERTNLDSILEILSKRVRAHRVLNPDEEARVSLAPADLSAVSPRGYDEPPQEPAAGARA